MSRTTLLLVALGTAALATLASCGGGPETAPLRVYRHSLDEAPTSLDPVHAATVYSNYVIRAAYDTLYAYEYLARPYELEPNLAAAMPEISPDGLVYTIPIKQGVRFVDDDAFPHGKGRELTAQDVIYSIERHFDPANRSEGQWLWRDRIAGLDDWGTSGANYDADVAGLRAIDSHTLRIELTRPYPQLPHTLAIGFAAIVPREAVEHYGPEIGIHPVGSGPYKVESFDTAKAVLSANRAFRQESVDIRAEGYDESLHAFTHVAAIDGRAPPFLDGIEIHFIPDATSRMNSFEKGNEIQFTELRNEQADAVLASRNPPALLPAFAQRYDLSAGLEAGFLYLTFNFDFPEIGRNADPERAARNHALRCAMIKGFDWKARNDTFYFGLGRVFPGVIPPCRPRVRSAAFDDERRARCRGGAQAARGRRLDRGESPRARLRRHGHGESPADVRAVPRLHGAHRLSAGEDRVEALSHLRRSPGRVEAEPAPARLPQLVARLSRRGERAPALLLAEPVARLERLELLQSRVRPALRAVLRHAAVAGAHGDLPPHEPDAHRRLRRDQRHRAHAHPALAQERDRVSGSRDPRRLLPEVRRPRALMHYALRKLAGAVTLVLGVTFVSFLFMVWFAPDPTYKLLGKNPSAAQVEQTRQLLCLDCPFPVRYLRYLGELSTFDFGNSWSSGERVSRLLARTMPVSLALLAPGFVLGNALGLLLAMVAAHWRGRWLDRLIMACAVAGMSVSFVIALIAFQVVFSSSYGLDLFPVRGWDVHDFGDYLRYVTVPTLATIFVTLGYNTRFYRAVLVEELGRDHVRTARAFGASTPEVFLRNVCRTLPSPSSRACSSRFLSS
jgi:ABC-type dipeptide/oligopeptide/nickel transport system permease component/ABC-type transport system substrate-binding protein